jgi:DNA repair exonuclease SbcCD nuclease subunit
MRQAIAHANRLNVPLIVAGDLHDTKGAMRGECVKAMMDTFASRNLRLPCYVIPGNHDRINEKSKPHSLEFLRPLVSIVDVPTCMHGLWMVPYESDSDQIKEMLKYICAGSTLIMHTGLHGAAMGHYTRDTSSLTKDIYHGLRVISGHYHSRQDIEIPGGLFSYIGNPYTLNFGEALDPPKGFQVLNTDGSLTFVPTNLRKHVMLERRYNNVLTGDPECLPGDLIKLRVTGPKSELDKLSRKDIGEALFGHSNYKLDLVPDREQSATIPPNVPDKEQLDALIDASSETPEQKKNLKALWRTLV